MDGQENQLRKKGEDALKYERPKLEKRGKIKKVVMSSTTPASTIL